MEKGNDHQTQIDGNDKNYFAGSNHKDLILQNHEQRLVKKHCAIDKEAEVKAIQNQLFFVLIVTNNENVVDRHHQLQNVNQAEKHKVIRLLLGKEIDEYSHFRLFIRVCAGQSW